MRLLIVEDSEILRDNLAHALRRDGFAVDVEADGPSGLWRAQEFEYNVVVLDLMLPGLDGLEVLRRLRDGGHDMPIVILTARDAVPDRVRGLRDGADDYLVKPFDYVELLARIERLIRRRHGSARRVIDAGALSIDLSAKTVRRDGVLIPLPPREYALLELLALRRGEVIARAEIEERIYDDRVAPMSNVVDSAVASLRRAIDRPGDDSLIITRRGLGYMLRA